MKKFLPYFALLKNVKVQFIGALICAVIYGITSGFGLPILTTKLFPQLFGEENPSQMVLLIAVAYLPVVFLIRNISGFANEYLISFCGIKILEDIRIKVFSKIQALPISYFQNKNHGDLISRIMNDTEQVKATIIATSNDLLKQPVTFLGAMGALIYLSLRNEQMMFILFSLSVIPICIFPIRYVGKKIHARAKSMQQEMGVVTEVVSENLSAIREIRAFSMEESQINKFLITIKSLFKLQLKVVKYTKILSPIIEFVSSIGVAVAIYYAAKSRVGLEEVIALIIALHMSYDPIKKMGGIHNQIKKGLGALGRIEEILDEPVSIKDKPNAVTLDNFNKQIEFKNVSFNYDKTPALRSVDCLLATGQTHALVGPSGAGKTTFANLLMRFYDSREGSILLDDISIDEIKIKSLRKNISIVPQAPMLFNDTILNNIKISKPDASEDEIKQAAKKAFADQFIESLQNGYNTVVGEDGTNLSGGQKQRIAIARAFLKNSPILILDEATSALDSESENKIQSALKELIKGKTVIIIAHRFSTIQMANQILVFDEGKIIQSGNHQSLYQSCDLYKSLYDRQTVLK